MFDSRELLSIAIRIEENGENFYRQAAGVLEDQEVRLIFSYLADEESSHKEIFTDLLAETSGLFETEDFPEDYFDYLKAYVDGLVFGRELRELQTAALQGSQSAIQFAIQQEAQSILYYQEVGKLVSKAQQPLVEKIIAEERRHFTKLSALKKSLGG